MPTVADVLRRYGQQYLEQFGTAMPGEHKKVLRAICACRTGELGTVLYACRSCGSVHDILAREGVLPLVAPEAWERDWVVNSQAVGDGRASLRYLAPYVFRVAIGNHRVVSCDHDRVVFTYRRVGSNRPRRMTLDAMEFIRRFLQHVLPAGFQKVRHYGFFSPNSSMTIEVVRWLVTLHNGAIFSLALIRPELPAARPAPRCPSCGSPMAILKFSPRPQLLDTS